MSNSMYVSLVVLVVAVGTLITRFTPFILFPENRKTPPYIEYLGKVLPFASIAMIVVYALKDTVVTDINNIAPRAIAVLFIVLIHLWKKNTLVSIAGGTGLYMLLVQFVFV